MSNPYAPFKTSKEFLNSFNLPIQQNVHSEALTICEHNNKKQIIKETYLNGLTSKLGDNVIQKKGYERIVDCILGGHKYHLCNYGEFQNINLWHSSEKMHTHYSRLYISARGYLDRFDNNARLETQITIGGHKCANIIWSYDENKKDYQIKDIEITVTAEKMADYGQLDDQNVFLNLLEIINGLK
tara:strand:+ start:351 stop:905 length:555 start_codon:yes stop_codon:yes gene_type:complete